MSQLTFQRLCFSYLLFLCNACGLLEPQSSNSRNNDSKEKDKESENVSEEENQSKPSPKPSPAPHNTGFDSSFGVNGRVKMTDLEADKNLSVGVALQSDGKIIVASTSKVPGAALVYRLLPDGSLDNSFGVNGMFHLTASGGSPSIKQVYVRPNGKIIVGGPDTIIFLNANGTLDTSLGSSGEVTTGGGDSFAVLPDGTIFASKERQTSWAPPHFECRVTKILPNGVKDPGIWSNGVVDISHSQSHTGCGSIVYRDGLIFLGGKVFDAVTGYNTFMYALKTDDGNYSPDYSALAPFEANLADGDESIVDVDVDAGGKVIALSYFNRTDNTGGFAIQRESNFTMTTLFTQDTPTKDDRPAAISPSADGSMLVLGTYFMGGSLEDNVLYRVLSNGQLDQKFFNNASLFNLGTEHKNLARSLAKSSDDLFAVVAGFSIENEGTAGEKTYLEVSKLKVGAVVP